MKTEPQKGGKQPNEPARLHLHFCLKGFSNKYIKARAFFCKSPTQTGVDVPFREKQKTNPCTARKKSLDLSPAFALLDFESNKTEQFRIFSHFIFPCRVNFMTFKNRMGLHMGHISSFSGFQKC